MTASMIQCWPSIAKSLSSCRTRYEVPAAPTTTAPTIANVVTGENGVVNGLLSHCQTELTAPVIEPPFPSNGATPCCCVPVPIATPVEPAIGYADEGSTAIVVPDAMPNRDGSMFDFPC